MGLRLLRVQAWVPGVEGDPVKLSLAHHTIDEWCEVRAAQARSLGCSESYVRRLVADLQTRFAL